MNKKRSGNDQHSTSNEVGIFLFLTLVIFFGAVGFPTLINTSPTIGYDDNTIAKLTPVTSYYQQAFAEQREMGVLSNYFFDPNLASAFMVLPTTVDLPPPDMVSYFLMKYSQGIDIEQGFIEFEKIQDFLEPKINKILDLEILPSAFAVHTTSTAETNIINGTWEYREANHNAGGSEPACSWINSGSGSSGGVEFGQGGSTVNSDLCYIWKKFPTNFLNNTEVEVDWTGTYPAPSATDLVQTRVFYTNLDFINRTSEAFLGNNLGLIGDNNDDVVGTIFSKEHSPSGWARTFDTYVPTEFAENMGANDGDFTYLVLVVEDITRILANGRTLVHTLNITDNVSGGQKVFFNFSGSTVNSENTGSCLDVSFDCDFGTIEAGSFQINATSGLHIIQQHNNELLLDWDDFAGAIDYEVYRDDVWIGNVTYGEFGDVLTSEFSDKKVAGDLYNYSVRADIGGEFTEFGEYVLFEQLDTITGFTSVINGIEVDLTWDTATGGSVHNPITSIDIYRKNADHISENFDTRLVGENPTDVMPIYWDHRLINGQGTLRCGDFMDGVGQLTGEDDCIDYEVYDAGGGDMKLMYNVMSNRQPDTSLSSNLFIANLTYPDIERIAFDGNPVILSTEDVFSGNGFESFDTGRAGHSAIYYFQNGTTLKITTDIIARGECTTSVNYYDNGYSFCNDDAKAIHTAHGLEPRPFGQIDTDTDFTVIEPVGHSGNFDRDWNATAEFLQDFSQSELDKVVSWEFHAGFLGSTSQSSFVFPDVRSSFGHRFNEIGGITAYNDDGSKVPIGNWTKIASLFPNATDFTDTGLDPLTNYVWKIFSNSTGSPSSGSPMSLATNTTATATVIPPASIIDLEVRIENTTNIYEGIGGSSTSFFGNADNYPRAWVQTIPTQTIPVLIDSLSFEYNFHGSARPTPDGILQGVIIGDRTGDLDFDSQLSDTYFIENSTNIISTSGLGSGTILIFNFSGNTILDSGDSKVGIGVWSTSDNSFTGDMDGTAFVNTVGQLAGGHGLMLNQNNGGCVTVDTFERALCSDIATDGYNDLIIFGGNGRAILNWTAPASPQSPITGYEILRTDSTSVQLTDEGDSTGTVEEAIGSNADPLGFVGQRITFPEDIILQSLVWVLGRGTASVGNPSGTIQGVVLEGATAGTSGFTRVANSTNIHTATSEAGLTTTFGQFQIDNDFSFSDLVLEGGVEYVIGVEVLTETTGTAHFGTSSDPDDATGHPFSGLGVFTENHIGTSDLWTDTAGSELNADTFGFNFTVEVIDTGNTDIEYTSTADYPTSDEKINAYKYMVSAINSGGNGNASNFVEASPDRSDSFDAWQFAELDTREAFFSNCSVRVADGVDQPKSQFGLNQTEFTGAIGACWIFKSFDKSAIDGSDIKIDWHKASGINGVVQNTHLTRFQVLDGAYDKDDIGDFPRNNFHTATAFIKGAGELNSTSLYLSEPQLCEAGSSNINCSVIIPASDIDYASSTESQITVFFGHQGSASSFNKIVTLKNIEISNIGSWNFTQSPRIIQQINLGASPAIPFENSNQDDRGVVIANSVFNGTVTIIPDITVPASITDLNATQTNSIFLNWTAPDDGGSPITGYEIERSRSDIAGNGTYLGFLIREAETSGGNALTIGIGTQIPSGSEGFAGQAINVTTDAEVGAIQLHLVRQNGACSGSADLQGGIFFINGTRVENSTNVFDVCSIENEVSDPDEEYIFNFNNTEIFSGEEYAFGVEKIGTNTDGIISVGKATNLQRNATTGFTTADIGSAPFTFVNQLTNDTGITVFTLNFTTIVSDSGNTNTNYTDNTCPAGITCYYRANGINAIGTAGSSNIANATETINSTTGHLITSENFEPESLVWSQSGTRITNTTEIEWDAKATDTVAQGLAHDFGADFVDKRQWKLRFNFTIDTFAFQTSNSMSLGIGLFAEDETKKADIIVSGWHGIYGLWSVTSPNQNVGLTSNDGAGFTGLPVGDFNFELIDSTSASTAVQTSYVDITKLSPEFAEMTIYTDADYTIKKFPTQSIELQNGLNEDLRYLMVKAFDNAIVVGGSFDGEVDDIEYYSGELFNNFTDISSVWNYRTHDPSFGAGTTSGNCSVTLGTNNCGAIADIQFGTLNFTSTKIPFNTYNNIIQIDTGYDISSLQPSLNGEGYLFKVFTRDSILNQNVSVGWEQGGQGTSERNPFLVIYDGAYIAEDFADFPYNKPIVEKGGGLLGLCESPASTEPPPEIVNCLDGLDGNDDDLLTDIDWSLSTEDFITVMIRQESTKLDTKFTTPINMTITNLGFWNFTDVTQTATKGVEIGSVGEADLANSRGDQTGNRNVEVDEESGYFSQGVVTAIEASVVTPPASIIDLQVKLGNFTEIYDSPFTGSVYATESETTASGREMFVVQQTPDGGFAQPTLIDSLRWGSVRTVGGSLSGELQGVIIGDRTGDLVDGSSVDNIYVIENSTNIITSIVASPSSQTVFFNFSGNTIIDSNDNKVGIGVVHRSSGTGGGIEARSSLSGTNGVWDGFALGTSGITLSVGESTGSCPASGNFTHFQDVGCVNGVGDIANFQIYGGNARAVLNWTAPADNGDAITGYEIAFANNTEQIIYRETFLTENNVANKTTGVNTNGEISLGSSAFPNGDIAGQRITFPQDFVVTSLVISMGAETDVGGYDGVGGVQGVILKDAPSGTSEFTLVANSTDVATPFGVGTTGDFPPNRAYFFSNPPNCCAEALSFEPTVLTGGVEYIIGVRPVDVNDPITIFADFPDNSGHPNNGLGQFTQLNSIVSPTWLDNSTLNLNAQIFGYNFTTIETDTGTTTTNYTDTTNDYPSLDGKINARSYTVKAINTGGSANASNYVEVSPDRDLFDTWQLREKDVRHLFDLNCEFKISTDPESAGSPLEMEWDSASEVFINHCSMFKSFDKADITGSDIRFVFNTTSPSADATAIMYVRDGGYDKDNSGDWAKGTAQNFIEKGIGILNQTDKIQGGCGGDFCDITIPASAINYSGSTESQITVELAGSFSQGGEPDPQRLQVGLIEISNVGSWNFFNSPRILHTIANGLSVENGVDASDVESRENLAFEDDRASVVANAFFNGTVVIIPPITPPEVIVDLEVRIENTTQIYDGGTSDGLETANKYPAFHLQTIPTQSTPTLIDSVSLFLNDGVIVAGGTTGEIHGVIIGDRTGDLDFDSKLSDIYFIENSTQTISSAQTWATTVLFNFSGNTILDSGDDQVGVGIYITNHTRILQTDTDNSDGTGIIGGTGLFLGNICGSLDTFERDGCSDIDTSNLQDMNIYGGNARAVLNWTAPVDNGDAITGYTISIANATSTNLIDQRISPADTDFTHDIGTLADGSGIAGQRVTFPNDVVIHGMMVGLEDGSFPIQTSGLIQAVILKDAPDGTGAFTVVANSSKQFLLPTCCSAGQLSQNAEIHANIGGAGTESFGFNNTVLTGGVEYVIGIRASGIAVSTVNPIRTAFSDQDGSPTAFTSLGNFTYLDSSTLDLWNTTNDEFSIALNGYNYTTEVVDTGSTNVEYTSTADFPDFNDMINAYSFTVKAINSGGSANSSNFVEVSPDRSDSIDTWSFVEHDGRQFFYIQCEFGNEVSNPFAFNVTETGISDCFLFKSFDKNLINGSDIRFVMNKTHDRPRVVILDGGYDKDSHTDFPPFGSRIVKGAGALNTTDFTLSNGFGSPPAKIDHIILASQIDYASSTEDEITVMIESQSSGFPSQSEFQMELIEISNVGSWNFTQNPRIIQQIDLGEASISPQYIHNFMDDRGTVQSKSVINGSVTVGGVNSTQTEQDFISVVDQTVLESPPFPITDLIGSTVSMSCDLTWSEPVTGGSPITKYQIFRSVNGAPYSFLVNTTFTNHTDSGLVNLVVYDYNVTSINTFGDSESSNIDDCNPVVSDPPTQPLSLTAINVGADVQLDWLESADGDPTGYQIQRKVTSSGTYITIENDTATTSLTYLDTTVSPSTEYVYRIGAWNDFGLSPFSEEATINTLDLPSTPVITGVQVGDLIKIDWTEPASGLPINGYKIDRRINLGTLVTYIANTTTTSLTFSDSNVTKPDTFGYRVTALTTEGEGTVSNIVDIVFGSHLVIHVREQDGSGFKGGGFMQGFNATFSDLIGLNATSDAVFDNLPNLAFNFTFFDDDDFILNKTFNIIAPAGNDTSEFTINALVFDVDCPDNGVGTDVRIKVNYTTVKDITEFPSPPVCDSTEQVSWSTTWSGGAINDTSTMIADFISPIFKANAEQFLASSDIIPTIYNSGANQIESDVYTVNMTLTTINFNLFLGTAPAGGGGGGDPPPSAPPVPSIPDPEIVFGQRLTGLNLLSRTHTFAQAGEILTGSVTINWEGEPNLSVKSIDTNLADLDIRFDETVPFDLNQQIDGIGEFAMSTAEITYTIVLPPQDCNADLGITQNCFDPTLHTLPIEFQFEREGQVYEASTEVFVDGRPIPLDIVQLQIILLFLVLVASAVFGNIIRKRFQKTTRRTKKVKTKFKKKFDSS